MAKSIDIRQLSKAISFNKDNGTKVNYSYIPNLKFIKMFYLQIPFRIGISTKLSRKLLYQQKEM